MLRLKKPILWLFPLVALLYSTMTFAETFEEVKARNTLGIRPSDLVGVGVPFALKTMKDETSEFGIVSEVGKVQDSAIKYFLRTQVQGTCRLYGYLNACSHPFVEYNGTLGNKDVSEPFDIDFMVTNEYLEPSAKKPADVEHFPLFVAGVVPIFNVPGVSRLVMTRSTLAKIFRVCNNETSSNCASDFITHWNDPEIKATNPDVPDALLDAAGAIKPVLRKNNAGATYWFKRALANFDKAFGRQVKIDNSQEWNNTIYHIKITDPGPVVEYVHDTPGTIAYASTNFAYLRPVGRIDITQNGFVTSANNFGLKSAFTDLAVDYGNDGRPASEHTIDLTVATASHAWPIAYPAYIVFRTQNRGTAETCEAKTKLLLEFLKYFYTSDAKLDTSEHWQYFSRLPEVDAAELLKIIQHKLQCDGVLVEPEPAPPVKVKIYSKDSIAKSLDILSRSFVRSVNTDQIEVSIETFVSQDGLERAFIEQNAEVGYIAFADENLSFDLLQNGLDAGTSGTFASLQQNIAMIPFAALSSGFIYNFCSPEDPSCTLNTDVSLILDIDTAALILEGQITWWNDSAIQSLNPNVTLPQQPILAFTGRRNSDFYFDFIQYIRKYYMGSFTASGSGIEKGTYAEVFQAVSSVPFSFAHVPLNGTYEPRVQMARVRGRRGPNAIAPSYNSVEACAKDTYNRITGLFKISESKNADCYPLSTGLNMIIRHHYNSISKLANETARITTRLAKFILDGTIRPMADFETVLSSSGFGTLADFSNVDQKIDIKRDAVKTFEAVTLNGESILVDYQNMHWIPLELQIAIFILLAIEMTVYIFLAIWVVYYRNRKLVRNSSPTFMIQVLFGAALMSMTCVPLAMQDDFIEPRVVSVDVLANMSLPLLDHACLTQPILFSIGFFILFSALFLKSWRLIRIFNNTKLRNLFLRDKQLLIYQALVLLVVFLLNLIWAVQSPLIWVRAPLFIDSASGLVMESVGLCYSPQGIFPALPLMFGVAFMLFLGNYLAYLGRKIPTEFNESKWIGMSMVVSLESIVMGIPVLILANEQPVAGFIVKAFITLLISGATVGLIFFPKLAVAYGWGQVSDSNPWQFIKKSSQSSNNKEQNIARTASKKQNIVNPSLNSIVSGKVVMTNTSKDDPMVAAPLERPPSIRVNHLNAGRPVSLGANLTSGTAAVTNIIALKSILEDDPTRRRFRRYLQTLKMDENIRFWDSVTIMRSEPNPDKRAALTRAIVQTFVLDSSPLQVNLSSKVRESIIQAYKVNDRTMMARDDFLQPAMDELFSDLRQSDAFRVFLEHDTFSAQDLSKSDPTILVGMDGNHHSNSDVRE